MIGNRRIRRTIVAAAVAVLSVTALSAGSAAATDDPTLSPQPQDASTQSTVLNLCSNASLYSWFEPSEPHRDVIRTVHDGRGFRVYGFFEDSLGRVWAYGHSAEAQLSNGFILADHLC